MHADTIYVRVFEDRMDLLRVVMVGASGTPYHDRRAILLRRPATAVIPRGAAAGELPVFRPAREP